MKYILLPGNSVKNKEIFEEFKHQLEHNPNNEVLFIQYDHWNNNSKIDISKEKGKLVNILKANPNSFIIAKSM